MLVTACGEEIAAGPLLEADVEQADAAGEIQQTAGTSPTLLSVGATATTGAIEVNGTWLPESRHIKVQVSVAHFADLFGVAGHLHYDPEILQLTALQAIGVPMGKKGAGFDYTPKAMAKESPVGRLLVGGARIVNQPSPFYPQEGIAVERETWLVLEFAVLAEKSTKIAFDPGTLVVKTGDYKDLQADWGHLDISWQTGAVGGAP